MKQNRYLSICTYTYYACVYGYSLSFSWPSLLLLSCLVAVYRSLGVGRDGGGVGVCPLSAWYL